MGERACIRHRQRSLRRVVISYGIGSLLCGALLCGFGVDAIAQYSYSPPTPAGAGTEGATQPPWLVVPSLGLGETWTDNVNLAPPGQQKTDLITSISPDLTVTHQSARLQSSLDFSPQILIFDLGTSSPIFQPNMLGTGHAEIVPETFFFDGSAAVSQNYVNLAAAVAPTTLTTSSNLQTTETVNASPYLVHHFGDY